MAEFSRVLWDKVESIFPGYDGDQKTYLLTLFLPYNPCIHTNTLSESMQKASHFWWPLSRVYLIDEPLKKPCDLLWIDSDDEFSLLSASIEQLKSASAIFTTTHFFDSGQYFQNIKFLLELSGFSLFGHWYWENLRGEAMFIRSDILKAALNSLNYTPCQQNIISSISLLNKEKHFRKIEKKTTQHKIDQIDFIYMINLEERPEKFERASLELSRYGIQPFRFSAVNGWKLSTAAINEIGVKFTSSFNEQQFLGSIYREIEGKEYLGSEIIRSNGETFFTLGLSRGAMGIILSHLSILQDAYDSGYETIWIMEDDIEAIEDPRQLSSLIQKLDTVISKWDILFTDTDTKDRQGNHVPCRSVAARPNFNIEPLSSFYNRFYSLSPDFSRIGMRYGAYSMIIRRSGIEKILNHFKTYGIFIPYDMDFWLNSDLIMVSPTKDIVSHQAGAPTDNSEPNYLK
ncbi:MAG TPA: glycosyltransferase family 25 protein [Chlamydiales bacterium]|nr:glycosyltransferase family 25 protein [Chlamydiales bacterium]